MPGTLALVGGGEWQDGCVFDRALLDASGADEVLVVPTAAAYEHPDRLVEGATRWFGELGATVRSLPVLSRADALRPENVSPMAEARCIYLAGGSPMHLRSVLKDSPVWDALVEAWQAGATVAGSSAGAMVLCDPMVDPRGGALTLGLGLVDRRGRPGRRVRRRRAQRPQRPVLRPRTRVRGLTTGPSRRCHGED